MGDSATTPPTSKITTLTVHRHRCPCVFFFFRKIGHDRLLLKRRICNVDCNRKSGINSPVEVGSLSDYSIIYKVLDIQKVVFSPDFWTINSMSEFFGDCFCVEVLPVCFLISQRKFFTKGVEGRWCNSWVVWCSCFFLKLPADHTVDGSEILLTSWYGKYPILYRVLYIPSG